MNSLLTVNIISRVATNLENLEESGHLTVIRDKSGKCVLHVASYCNGDGRRVSSYKEQCFYLT